MAINDTIVTIRGWVGADPTIYRNGSSDTESANNTSNSNNISAVLNVGVTPRSYSRKTGQYKDGETAWYSVRAFGRLAENISSCVKKGTPLLVRGKLTSRTFLTKEKETRTSQVILADAVGIEISIGVANYMRGGSVHPNPPDIQNAGIETGKINPLTGEIDIPNTSPLLADTEIHDPWASENIPAAEEPESDLQFESEVKPAPEEKQPVSV
ncbi:single-stranded DNA-binding protein [Arcanobacterium hippocoleae]